MAQELFTGVEDTLFIPLAGRVEMSKRFPEYFYDEKALELADSERVRRVAGASSEYSMMASVCRYYNTDRFVRDFLDRHPAANVISLGVGLETMNYRVNRPGARFYSIDFPKVIEDRRRVLGCADNEVLVGCDINDMTWTKEIDPKKPAFLLLSGVFQYFHREEVLRFLKNVREFFEDAELAFDATDEVGIRYAQRYVKKTGNMSAMMHFYVNDPAELAREAGVELLEVRGFFDEARRMIGRRLKLYTRIAMAVADGKKRTMLIRVRL